jgi:uncharacterized protein with FMN-binding domain
MQSFVTRSISLVAVVLTLIFYNGTLNTRKKSEEIMRLQAEADVLREEASEENDAGQQSASAWKDGTYSGSGQGFGGEIDVDVKIDGGKIADITVTSHSGEDGTYFSMAEAITENIVEAQSADVDTISGATFSSTGIRDAVKDALGKAEQ